MEACLIAIAAVFAPIKGLLVATLVLTIADMLSGIVAASKRGEAISSAGLRRSVSKIVIYEIAIVLAFIAETYMSDLIPFTKIVSSLVSVVELKSIYENLNAASGQDLLKSVIDKLGSVNQDIK